MAPVHGVRPHDHLKWQRGASHVAGECRQVDARQAVPPGAVLAREQRGRLPGAVPLAIHVGDAPRDLFLGRARAAQCRIDRLLQPAAHRISVGAQAVGFVRLGCAQQARHRGLRERPFGAPREEERRRLARDQPEGVGRLVQPPAVVQPFAVLVVQHRVDTADQRGVDLTLRKQRVGQHHGARGRCVPVQQHARVRRRPQAQAAQGARGEGVAGAVLGGRMVAKRLGQGNEEGTARHVAGIGSHAFAQGAQQELAQPCHLRPLQLAGAGHARRQQRVSGVGQHRLDAAQPRAHCRAGLGRVHAHGGDASGGVDQLHGGGPGFIRPAPVRRGRHGACRGAARAATRATHRR
ncbi:hypothetical protein ABID97_001028 [Variovorax sp. OAS795]